MRSSLVHDIQALDDLQSIDLTQNTIDATKQYTKMTDIKTFAQMDLSELAKVRTLLQTDKDFIKAISQAKTVEEIMAQMMEAIEQSPNYNTMAQIKKQEPK